MKTLYILAFSIIALTFYVVYKDTNKWKQPAIDYSERCSAVSGMTYLVRTTDEKLVFLCVDTTRLSLDPKIID